MSDSSHPGLAEPMSKEEWREFVDTPLPAKPARPKTYAAYQALPAQELERLRDARFAYHSALVVAKTPEMRALHHAMERTLLMNRNAPAGARRGHIIDGAPTLGKSTMVKSFGSDHERALRRRFPERWEVPGRDYVPVVYISIPDSATPKMLSIRFAEYLGLPLASSATQLEITDAVLRAMKMCGTEVVIIDDIHFLDCAYKDARRSNDHLKYLQNHTAATFIYAGVNLSHGKLFAEGLGENAAQTAGRFSRLPVTPFGQSFLAGDEESENAESEMAEWCAVVKTFESALDLYKHKADSLTNNHWEYLLRRTQGRISTLAQLMRAGAIEAILSGSEKVDIATLEAIDADWTAEVEYDKHMEALMSRSERKRVKLKARTKARVVEAVA